MKSQCLGITHWYKRVVKLLLLKSLPVLSFFLWKFFKVKVRIQKRFSEHLPSQPMLQVRLWSRATCVWTPAVSPTSHVTVDMCLGLSLLTWEREWQEWQILSLQCCCPGPAMTTVLLASTASALGLSILLSPSLHGEGVGMLILKTLSRWF